MPDEVWNIILRYYFIGTFYSKLFELPPNNKNKTGRRYKKKA